MTQLYVLMGVRSILRKRNINLSRYREEKSMGRLRDEQV